MTSSSTTLARRSAATRQHPEPNFDRIAHIYRWAEYLALGPLLKRTREQFLPDILAAQHALILGDGDGRFTAALLANSPTVRIRAVDISASMLRLLRTRCERTGVAARLQTHRQSALAVYATPDTDLIVTHFLLDCFNQQEVDTLAHRLASEVGQGCLWLVSDFGLPQNRLLRPLAAAYVRLLYVVFRLLTGLRPQHLPDSQRALTTAGFTRLKRKERLAGLLFSELWQRNVPQNRTKSAQPAPRALPSTCK